MDIINNMFSKRLKDALDKNNMRAADLCEKTGIGKSAISQYLNGIVMPKQNRLGQIARALDVSVAYLMGWDDSSENDDENLFITYPVVVGIRAGYGGEVQFEYSGNEQIPKEWIRGYKKDDFIIARVIGDSMYPMFLEGDRVLVHKTPSVDSGSIAVMRLNGDEVTLKRVVYKPGEDWFELQPINTAYPPKRVEGMSLNECGVVGEVKRLIRSF